MDLRKWIYTFLVVGGVLWAVAAVVEVIVTVVTYMDMSPLKSGGIGGLFSEFGVSASLLQISLTVVGAIAPLLLVFRAAQLSHWLADRFEAMPAEEWDDDE